MNHGLPPVDAQNSYVLYEDVRYDEFWNSPAKQKLDQLEHALVGELLPQRGSRIIDVGCGYGRLSDCYFDRFEQVIMFDGSLSLLRTAQKRYGSKAVYVRGDANQLPFCQSAFDAMLLIRVLHHLPDIRAFLSQASQLLCSNAALVLSYSNKRNALQVMRYALRLQKDNPFSLTPLASEPNFIHHHPDYISEILSSCGFRISHSRGAGVIDKLAAPLGPIGSILPPGVSMAPVLGRTHLAPWIFCRANAEHGSSPDPKPATGINDILACPACHAKLMRCPNCYECAQCNKEYAILDGIIDMQPMGSKERDI